MNRTRCIKTFVLVLFAVAMVGCKSKQETPAAQGGAPQPEAVKSISGERTTGTVTASPKDKADVEAAATQVMVQMESGDFATIYKNASPTFQSIGKEADFAAKFEKTRQLVGPLNKPVEASFITLPDKTHVVVYHVENDKYKTERRLSFVRSKEGKILLFGLNQHDEPKKTAAK